MNRKERAAKMASAKRGFLLIMSGTILAQIITFLLIPLISRLYSAEDYGALTLITAISSLLAPIASMRLDTAMMLPRKNSHVQALLFIGLTSSLVVSGVTALVFGIFLFFKPETAPIPFMPLWLFLTIVLTSLFTLLNRLALRKSGFGEVGKRTVAQSIGTGAGQLACSFYPGGGLGLVYGSLLGRCAGLVPLFRFTREFFVRPNFQLSKKMLRRYWKFPVFFAPSSLLNAFGIQAPLIFVSAWFGIVSAGVLGMAERIISAPMTLIGRAAAQVLDSEFSRKMRAGHRNYIRLYMKASLALGAVGLIVGLSFFLLAEWAVPLFLGEGWQSAAACVKLMSLAVALRLVATPTGVVISLFEESRGMLSIDVTRTVLIIAVMGIVVQNGISFLDAVFLIYSVLAIVYGLTWVFGLRVVWKHTSKSCG